MLHIIFKMSLDKFGRSAVPHATSHQLLIQREFTYTKDGNVNIGNLKLCNVQSPTEGGDASTKDYVDLPIENLYNKVHISNEKLGALGEAVDDISLQVKSSMNRIQELDQFLNAIILDDLRTLNDLARETGEKVGQLTTIWEDRFQKLEQFKVDINIQIDQIKHVLNIM